MWFSCEVIVRQSDQLHCRRQIVFVARNKCDVAFFRRPAMRLRFALGKNSFLISFRQSDVAMAMAMDVHEHLSADKKGVFVDSSVLTLGHIRQSEDSLPQFLMQFVL